MHHPFRFQKKAIVILASFLSARERTPLAQIPKPLGNHPPNAMYVCVVKGSTCATIPGRHGEKRESLAGLTAL